ncbi:MAG: hypothetical protein K6E28_11190 [Eubacterium sp.]|nr:hypothetical protein [Eubacterium sp.]
MIIRLKDTEIKLNDMEVKSTKRLVSQFLDSVRNATEKEIAPTYWFTLLVMMHIMSQDMLDDYDIETIALIMDKLGRK